MRENHHYEEKLSHQTISNSKTCKTFITFVIALYLSAHLDYEVCKVWFRLSPLFIRIHPLYYLYKM